MEISWESVALNLADKLKRALIDQAKLEELVAALQRRIDQLEERDNT